MKFDYDLLVVGSGPAGEGAAMAAIKNGLRVAAVENREDVGGSCLHKGTIPSKSLRHVIQQIIRYKKSHIFNQLGTHAPSLFLMPLKNLSVLSLNKWMYTTLFMSKTESICLMVSLNLLVSMK